jgi:hypothetical protein
MSLGDGNDIPPAKKHIVGETEKVPRGDTN